MPRGTMYATIALIAINVLVFLVQMAQGTHLVSGLGGSEIVQRGALIGSAVADGDWWRLITAGFIHAGLLHIGFNMYALWWLGGALERYAGPFRMVAIYFTSILWGSAAAVLTTPSTVTVGASGGVFGLMAALLVLERQKGIALLGGSVGGLLVLNLIITFAFPGISIGGHIGGILGGAAAALVLSGFGRGHLAYGRLNPPVLIGLAVLVAGALVAGILIAQARTPMV